MYYYYIHVAKSIGLNIRPWHPSCKTPSELVIVGTASVKAIQISLCDITGFLPLLMIVAVLNNCEHFLRYTSNCLM